MSFTEKLFVFKYCFIFIGQGQTPLHFAAQTGKTELVDLLLKSGASPSVLDNEVIKPSVKLRESNIKFFK